MAGISDKIKVYNEALKIAWSQISDKEKTLGTGPFKVSELIGNVIRSKTKLGRTDAANIASEAVDIVLGPLRKPQT